MEHFSHLDELNQFHFAAWESCRLLSAAPHRHTICCINACPHHSVWKRKYTHAHARANMPLRQIHKHAPKKNNAQNWKPIAVLCIVHFFLVRSLVFSGGNASNLALFHAPCGWVCELCVSEYEGMRELFTSVFRSDVTMRQSSHCTPRLHRVLRFVVYVRLITGKIFSFYTVQRSQFTCRAVDSIWFSITSIWNGMVTLSIFELALNTENTDTFWFVFTVPSHQRW